MRHPILAALLLLSLVPAPATADVVAASFLDENMTTYTNGGACSDWNVKGQTFVAGQSGQLVSVGLRLYASAGLAGLRVAVHAVDAGVPAASALCSEVFSTAGAPTSAPAALLTFVFTGPTPILQAGTAYAIVVESADTASFETFTWNGWVNTKGDYAGGTFMESGCTHAAWTAYAIDMSFEVIVDETVPNAESSWGGVKALFR